ncbi:MAG: SpoIIE family protein phosphatase [Bacteroidales bacterium]|jgi:serine phosphatase RsbU (regulator of sigma subunit)/tetratricopeptide (TPR) repeat protein|nr:SpoIIE family protein phosphatase [Bacteroidales bacterium]
MKRIAQILLFFFISGSFILPGKVYSQSKADSLKRILATTKSAYNKTSILYELALDAFQEKFFSQAASYANQSLDMAIQEDIKVLQAKNLFLMGKMEIQEKNHEKGLQYFLRSSKLFETLKDTTHLILVYEQVGDAYYTLNALEKAVEYYEKTVTLALAADIPVRNKWFEKTALTLSESGQYGQSIHYFRQWLQFVPEEQSEYLKIRIYSGMADNYIHNNQPEEALTSYHHIYNLFDQLKDTMALSVVANNMGFLYLDLNEDEKALASFRESLQLGLKAKIGTVELSKLYSNIGICYQNLKDFDNSIIYLRLALKTLENLEEYREKARLENLLATLFFNTGDLYNAEVYSRNSIESAKKANALELLSVCYHMYSRILREGNDPVSALEYYEKYLSLRDSILLEKRIEEQKLIQRIDALEKSEEELKLRLADEQLKDLALKQFRLEAEKRERELELLRSEKELEESEKDRLQQSLEIARQKHEAELRENELKRLEQEKEIQDLLLKQKEAEEKERQKEIALLESEKERQLLELEKQAEAKKRAQWMFALSSVIVVLILIGLVITRKKNTILAKQKVEIEEKNSDLEQKNEEITTQSERIIVQKDLIEKKNEEITASIHYARRIQNAVLPSVKMLHEYLSDYFILFKPKDIVSGDFYWAAAKNNKLIITAADCTGHGVPGAFMSLLGMSFLNEIVLKHDTFEADKILNDLRKEVIQSLKQSGREDEAKDGMDMALCVIDKERRKLQFAGANNPMYLIRKGELEKIKADRMPIGIHFRSDHPFTKQEFEIKGGETVYIFSDGFADQFGGDEGRKLKYKPFQELLSSIHSKSMKEQKEYLDYFFENWRGHLEQIDDVLVIGIKI